MAMPFLGHIYCINLPTSVERKNNMKIELEKLGIEFSFISAIHPKAKEYLNNIKNPRRVDKTLTKKCYCIRECEHKKRKLRPVEIAISLSHYTVYNKIIRAGQSWALVCEDDILLHSNFIDICNQIMPLNLIESDKPLLINCGGSNDNYKLRISEPDKFKLVIQTIGCYSNYCYFINLAAAKVLVKNFFPINRPEDSYKRYLTSRNKIISYRFSPTIVAELSAGRNMKPIYARLSRKNGSLEPNADNKSNTDKGVNKRIKVGTVKILRSNVSKIGTVNKISPKVNKISPKVNKNIKVSKKDIKVSKNNIKVFKKDIKVSKNNNKLLRNKLNKKSVNEKIRDNLIIAYM